MISSALTLDSVQGISGLIDTSWKEKQMSFGDCWMTSGAGLTTRSVLMIRATLNTFFNTETPLHLLNLRLSHLMTSLNMSRSLLLQSLIKSHIEERVGTLMSLTSKGLLSRNYKLRTHSELMRIQVSSKEVDHTKTCMHRRHLKRHRKRVL